jgi:hypothetical protein
VKKLINKTKFFKEMHPARVIKKMRLYTRFFEAGEEPGKLELAKMSFQQALDFCDEYNFDVLKEIPDFENNFKQAQKKAKMGWAKRRDMPVIDQKDVKHFQSVLESGKIDLEAPFTYKKISKNPFPTGLSGTSAGVWLALGLKDGEEEDDKVDVEQTRVYAGDLIPIQKQIYFDKSMGNIIKAGVKSSIDFIQHKSFFIISSNDYIIDGHHRFLSAMLLDPDIQVQCLMIDLPIKKLLPLSLAYGDAVGNKRNL